MVNEAYHHQAVEHCHAGEGDEAHGRRDREGDAAQPQGEHAAGEGQRDAGKHKQGLSQRIEGRKEQDEDQAQGQRDHNQ